MEPERLRKLEAEEHKKRQRRKPERGPRKRQPEECKKAGPGRKRRKPIRCHRPEQVARTTKDKPELGLERRRLRAGGQRG